MDYFCRRGMLTDEELKRALRTEKNVRKMTKILAICQIEISGSSYEKAAHDMMEQQGTIEEWHKRYLRDGLQGLDDFPRPGLPRMVKVEITEFVQGGGARPPRSPGSPPP